VNVAPQRGDAFSTPRATVLPMFVQLEIDKDLLARASELPDQRQPSSKRQLIADLVKTSRCLRAGQIIASALATLGRSSATINRSRGSNI